MAKLEYVFSRDEVEKSIPYRLICETRYGRMWDTMQRKRRWSEEFNEKERNYASKLFRQSHDWYLSRGIPDEVRIGSDTFRLWHKLGRFCASL